MSNRKVIITGGARGIGAALVRHFADMGDSVAFIYRSSDEAAGELSEETGISVDKERLVFLDTLREPSAFMDCYLCLMDEAGEDIEIILQEGETVDYQWVTFCEFETMIHRGLIPPPCAMRYGFVKKLLIDIIGDDAWLQSAAEEISTLENHSKEKDHG